jgi:hypothetical protein
MQLVAQPVGYSSAKKGERGRLLCGGYSNEEWLRLKSFSDERCNEFSASW